VPAGAEEESRFFFSLLTVFLGKSNGLRCILWCINCDNQPNAAQLLLLLDLIQSTL
jgi:hypothetical protein